MENPDLHIAILKALTLSFKVCDKDAGKHIQLLEITPRQIRLIIQEHNLLNTLGISNFYLYVYISRELKKMKFPNAGTYIIIERKHLNNLIKERNTKL